jgi:predicted dehydrogenase
MIKAGVIGLGKMGLSHCGIIGGLPNVHLEAVCDTSKLVIKAFKKYTKVDCYKDYKELIDSADIDCVIIAIPTKMHAEVVDYALNKGLHVFCEKPFVLDVEDGVELAKIAEKKGLVNQVGFHNRYVGTFNKMKELLLDSIIGEVYHFHAKSNGPVIVKEKAGNWRAKSSEGGGCLYDYASHVVNLVAYLISDIDKVDGVMLKKIFSKDVEDAVYSNLYLENGISGNLTVNWSDETYRKMSTEIMVLGKSGKIICDAQELRIYLKEPSLKHNLQKGWNTLYITDTTDNVSFYLRGEEYSSQLDDFVNSINSKNMDGRNNFRKSLSTDLAIKIIRDNG